MASQRPKTRARAAEPPPAVRVAKISDLTQDPRNANKGTERGSGVLEHSLRQYGAARSVVADRNLVLIAGNKTQEIAAQIGLEDAIIVPTDGTKLVVVQRTDLDMADPRARELAVADNRVGQLGLSWDGDQLRELVEEGANLEALFTGRELEALTAPAPAIEVPDDAKLPAERYGVMVTCASEEEQREVYERLLADGYTVKVVVV